MTEILRASSEYGFPLVMCVALLWTFHSTARWILKSVVEPLVTSHKEFLSSLEDQLDRQTAAMESLSELQGEVLKRLE